MQNLHCHPLFFFFLLLSVFSISSFSVNSYGSPTSKMGLQYHMGPVLTSPIKLYIIWYGKWEEEQASIIRDFLNSFSSPFPPSPSVVDWWKIVRLYTDQTGSNITASLTLAAESHDLGYSHGVRLRRLDIQSVIGTAVARGALPLDTSNGFYLVLTSSEVGVQDFCMAICGLHYYTFPTVVGATVPFAWVGNSGTQCPGTCAYPFVRPEGSAPLPPAPPGRDDGYNSTMGAPNGDTGVDGMISVIAHELAEASSDPFMSGWYAGEDSTAPTEIADMCEGVYGIGGGSGYVGEVERDKEGRVYNLNGVGGRRFLVQWVYDLSKGCDGPNNVHN